MNPWVIAIALLLILVAIPMVLWIASYKSSEAVMMFVITYVSLLVFVLLMVKRSMLEPHLYVDEKEIDKIRNDLQVKRQQVQMEFLRKEIEVLQRGERTPVLDVWRLNSLLLKRHPYFQKTETVLIDPKSQELQIRIQIGGVLEKDGNSDLFAKSYESSIISFIKIIARDMYLQQLKKFFQVIIVEMYGLREHEHERYVPFPFFSFIFPVTTVQQHSYTSLVDFNDLKTLGEIRFDGGSEIIPHRGIESLTARSME